MWGLIKKASEFIAPIITTDTLAEVKDTCDQSIRIIEGKEDEDTFTLLSSLDLVCDYLKDEVGHDDIPCFDYVTQESFVQKMADFLDKKLPKSHIAAILRFFLSFVNTELNTYYAQITIHRPFAIVASKLEDLYSVYPAAVLQFVKEVWAKSKKSPLMVEMMSFRTTDKISYPLLDFFCAASLNPEEIGSVAREAILYIVAQNDDPNNRFDETFIQYLLPPLYEAMQSFICSTCDCVTTIQFVGSTSQLLSWVDQLVMRTGELDMKGVIAHVKELDTPRKLCSVAFLLDFFSAKPIAEAAVELAKSDEILGLMIKSIDEGDDDSLKGAIALLKSMLLNTDLHEAILPPANDVRVDVLSFMPPTWIDQIDGSTSFEAYEEDATNRIKIVDGKKNGKNSELFGHVAKLLNRVEKLPLRTFLSLTHVIAFFTAAEASCIGNELAQAFEAACGKYSEIQTVELINEKSVDGPEIRAAILAECGKEIHATFLAHEKLIGTQKMFANELE